jgi:hypothetical protein
MIYDKRSDIPWYVKYLLVFKKPLYTTDLSNRGNALVSVTLCYKQLFGVTYVLSEITDEFTESELNKLEGTNVF